MEELYYTICPVESISHIAGRVGFIADSFSKLGIDLKDISTMPKQFWNLHFTHDHPHFIRDGGNIPPIWCRSEGADTLVIASTFSHRRQFFFVRRDSEIETIEDMVGKRVALPTRKDSLIDFWRATNQKGTISCLEVNGIGADQVEFVNIPVEDVYFSSDGADQSIWFHKKDFSLWSSPEFNALKQGIIDAVYSEGPKAWPYIKAKEFKPVYELSSHSSLDQKVNNCLPCVITVSTNLGKRHRKVVVAFLESIIRAAKWAKSNKNEVLNIFSQELYAPPDAIKFAFTDDVHKLLFPRLDEESIRTLEIEKAFLKSNGYIKNDFDVTDWVDNSFLEEAMNNIGKE